MNVDSCLGSVLYSLSSRYKGFRALSRKKDSERLVRTYQDTTYIQYFGDSHDPFPIEVFGKQNREKIYKEVMRTLVSPVNYNLIITPFSDFYSERLISLTITPIQVRYNGNDDEVRYLIDVFDMNEDRFKQANDLMSIEDERRRIIHDMRSVITTMGLFLDKIALSLNEKGGINVEECKTTLSRLSSSKEDLYRLIESYPSLNSIKKESLGVVRLKDVLDEYVERYIQRYDLRERLIYEEVKENFIVRGDEKVISSAVGNIIDNAFHFIDENGKIWVWISEHRVEMNNRRLNYAVINIKNNGPKIPDEIKPFVFVKNVSCRDGGTGCGLSNVKTAIENYGGTIELAKSDEESTLFKIYLERYM